MINCFLIIIFNCDHFYGVNLWGFVGRFTKIDAKVYVFFQIRLHQTEFLIFRFDYSSICDREWMKFPKRLNGDSCGKTYMYLKECLTCQIRELELLVPTKTWSPCVKYHSSSSLPEIFMNSRISCCASLGEWDIAGIEVEETDQYGSCQTSNMFHVELCYP